MIKHRVAVIGLAAIIIPLLASCGVFREVEEPSAPIEAIPLETEETEEVAPEAEAMEEETVAESTEEEMAEPTAEPIEEPVDEIEEPTPEPVEEATSIPAEEPESSADGPTVYEISQDDSEVRFELDEDLRGSRITVIGSTNQIAGQLAVDYADLASTQVGVIQINARTLATDNEFRNRAINNEILDTGTFEFITFTPTAVTGLTGGASVGDTITFDIVGDLTVRDVTMEVTFTVEATAVSDTQITGTASTVILRDDYGLGIPSVPSVANVEEEIELYIDFTANAVQ